VGEALVVLVLVFVYDRVREFAATRADLAIANGRRILSVESWTHVKIEPAMNRFLSQHSGLELLSSWYYQLMHLSVTLVVLLWIYWRHPIAYRSARNALIGINTIALAVSATARTVVSKPIVSIERARAPSANHLRLEPPLAGADGTTFSTVTMF